MRPEAGKIPALSAQNLAVVKQTSRDAVHEITTPQPAPPWARLERQLLAAPVPVGAEQSRAAPYGACRPGGW
jgi:hypothetical protein